MTNNISFKSTYRAVRGAEFIRASAYVQKNNFVNYPWRFTDSVKADKAMTTGVLDCSVLGITDGVKVLLMHICPTISENYNFDKIKKYIIDNIEIDNPNLQAALFGSQDYSDRSRNLFQNLNCLMTTLKIPCSIFRNCSEEFNVGYSSTTDEWIVSSLPIEIALTNNKISSEKVFKSNFKEVQLAPCDNFALDVCI